MIEEQKSVRYSKEVIKTEQSRYGGSQSLLSSLATAGMLNLPEMCSKYSKGLAESAFGTQGSMIFSNALSMAAAVCDRVDDSTRPRDGNRGTIGAGLGAVSD